MSYDYSKEAVAQAQEPFNELRAYFDREATQPLTRLDLGRVPVGQTFEKIIYLKNHSDKWPVVNIRLNESDPEVDVEFPQFVPPNTIRTARIVFHPSLTRREPLNIEHLFTGELWIG